MRTVSNYGVSRIESSKKEDFGQIQGHVHCKTKQICLKVPNIKPTSIANRLCDRIQQLRAAEASASSSFRSDEFKKSINSRRA